MENMKRSIDEYRAAVKKLAELRDGLVFENDNVLHAAIVCAAIFDNSSKIVRIYSNKMSGSFSTYPEYLEAISVHLRAGKEVRIMVDNNESIEAGNNPFIHKLKGELSLLPPNLKIGKASETFRNQIKELSPEKKILYFTTGDNSMFRLETDNNLHQAFVSFNKEDITTFLNSIFDRNFDPCFQTNTKEAVA